MTGTKDKTQRRDRRAHRRVLALAISIIALLGVAAAPASAFTAGVSQSGRTLSASYANEPLLTVSVTFSWQRCSGPGTGCVSIAGATAPNLQLTRSDVDPTRSYFYVTATARTLVGIVTGVASSPVHQAFPVPPAISVAPALTVTGNDGVAEGETLSGTTGVFGDPTGGGVTYDRQWYRCPEQNSVAGCEFRAGDVGSIMLNAGDVGKFMRFRVIGSAFGTTVQDVLTGKVANKPGQPGGDGGTGGDGGGGGTGGTGGSGGSGGDGGTGGTSGAKKMRPFPNVIIAGRLSGAITRITEFSVKGAKGAKVAITCTGKLCPYRKAKTRTLGKKRLRLTKLQTFYGSGAILQIRVTKKGVIGKYTEVKFRKGRAPARKDLCLKPGAKKPTRCS